MSEWLNIIRRKSSLLLCALLILLYLAYCLLNQGTGELFLSEDSHDYLDYARYLLSWTFPPSDLNYSAGRTPGYPLALAAAILITGDETSAVLLLHLGAALASLTIVPWALRGNIKPHFTILALIAVLLQCHQFFLSVLSEWVAINYLIILYALCVRWFRSPHPLPVENNNAKVARVTKEVFPLLPVLRVLRVINNNAKDTKDESKGLFIAIGLLSSWIVLTRPALLVTASVPLFLTLWRGPSLAKLKLAAVSYLPLLAWMLFNFYRLSVFAVVPCSGFGLFGVASLMYDAVPGSTGDQNVQLLATEFARNRSKLPEPKLENDNQTMERVYNRNLQLVFRLKEENRWTFPETNRIAAQFALLSIAGDFGRYFRFSREQLYRGFSLTPLPQIAILALAAVLLAGSLLKPEIAGGFLLMMVLHLMHLVFVAFAGIIFFRIYASTFYPLMFSGYCLAMTPLFKKRPSAAASTESSTHA